MKSKIHQILKNLLVSPSVMLISVLSGLGTAMLVYIYHFQLPLFSKSRVFICLIVAVVIALLVDIFLSKITVPIFRSKATGVRTALLAGSLMLTVLLSFSLSYAVPHIYPLYPQHTLVVNMDLRDLPAESEGVYFSHLQLAYRDVSFSELQLQGDYRINADSIFFPAGQSVSFSWQGITGEQAALYFYSSVNSLPVEIVWDGQSQRLDLASGSDMAKFTREFSALPYENLIVRLAAIPIILLILFILLTGLFSPHPYAYILLLIWLFIYILFWPGIIGDVNILAVDELRQGHPTDWHPIIFTLLLSFCIRIFASASSMLILQILALALLVGNTFSHLNRKGVSNKILIPISCVLALLPTNFLSIITLTNDIPYSIALMGLTFLAFRIVQSKGDWLQSKINLVLLTALSSLTILLRYKRYSRDRFLFPWFVFHLPEFVAQVVAQPFNRDCNLVVCQRPHFQPC